ncbi:MAG: ABC transporter permease subunit [Chloroflexota bacterium]
MSSPITCPPTRNCSTNWPIPRELEDAAIVDGANRWQLFWMVAAPLASGGMLVVAIYTIINVRGEYLFTITMIDKQDLYTIAVAIAMQTVGGVTVQVGQVTGYGASAAAYLIAAYPVIILVLLLQKWFVRGLMEGMKF